jgi:hypothetical protein
MSTSALRYRSRSERPLRGPASRAHSAFLARILAIRSAPVSSGPSARQRALAKKPVDLHASRGGPRENGRGKRAVPRGHERKAGAVPFRAPANSEDGRTRDEPRVDGLQGRFVEARCRERLAPTQDEAARDSVHSDGANHYERKARSHAPEISRNPVTLAGSVIPARVSPTANIAPDRIHLAARFGGGALVVAVLGFVASRLVRRSRFRNQLTAR